MAPTPVTILTGFLGSGKTTLILKLVPQLPKTYKLALLKNEFGDLEVDSQLASASAISGVREMINGCICCNLVGQLGDALETLRTEQSPDRIIIETSGSAFPATLALEVNRVARETNGERFVLDGVISVIDVENWEGYEDTSPTSKMQAQYTDFVVFNKWESVGERRFDQCLDRLGDLDLEIPWVKSDMGMVSKDVVLGIDGAMARELNNLDRAPDHDHEHEHGHGDKEGHQNEVEVLSLTLTDPDGRPAAVEQSRLQEFLLAAPKDEVYRIKGLLYFSSPPEDSAGEKVSSTGDSADGPSKYILNWAFGRWTYTSLGHMEDKTEQANGESRTTQSSGPTARMTIICARDESNKWKKRIENDKPLQIEGAEDENSALTVARVA